MARKRRRQSRTPVSVDYVARETASNLWRNRLMTMAAILTVAVSLTLVGAALLLRQGAANASGQWERGTQVTVWMQPNADKQEIHAVSTQLAQLNYVRQPCAYWDKARNFAEAKKILPSDVTAATNESEFPTSFWCTPVALSDASQVIATFKGTAGVYTVTAPLQQIHTEEKVINVLKWVLLGVAVVLIVSAAVLILNSIRMAIFSRRREVSVMKLVGATNWFIRVPYMSEGLIQGLLGSAISAGAVYILYLFINHAGGGTDSSNVFSAMHMTGWEVFSTDIVVVFVGVLIGSLGSAIAIRRFLDV
jgi:cell division transport system permease protein